MSTVSYTHLDVYKRQSVPIGDLINMCYSGTYTYSEIRRLINGNAGLMAYVGENDVKTVEERAAGGDQACGCLLYTSYEGSRHFWTSMELTVPSGTFPKTSWWMGTFISVLKTEKWIWSSR